MASFLPSDVTGVSATACAALPQCRPRAPGLSLGGSRGEGVSLGEALSLGVALGLSLAATSLASCLATSLAISLGDTARAEGGGCSDGPPGCGGGGFVSQWRRDSKAGIFAGGGARGGPGLGLGSGLGVGVELGVELGVGVRG